MKNWKTELRAVAEEKGLYRRDQEHDACGVGFVANIKGVRSHRIVEQALEVLANMEHRGATGCDPLTSDGAGILFQLPYRFFIKESERLGFTLPRPGQYGVGMLFLPVAATPGLGPPMAAAANSSIRLLRGT